MRPLRPLLGGLLSLVGFLFSPPPLARAQGSLTPPGAPALTMKRLDEIETRIAVQSLTGDGTAQFVINQSGSYYLTADISGVSGKSAIAINVDGVTLDLGGHALTGVSGTLRGVEFRSTRTTVVVQNGTIRNFDQGGVATLPGFSAVNCRFENLTIACAGGGLIFNTGTPEGVLARGCIVTGVTSGLGIVFVSTRGLVEHCVVNNIAGSGNSLGILAHTVTGCEVATISASGSSGAQGIVGSVVTGCTVTTVTNTGSGGAQGITSSSVSGCDVSTISTASGAITGISAVAVENCTVSALNCTSSGGVTGINAATVSGSRVVSIGTAAGTGGNPTGIIATSITGSSVLNVGGVGSQGTATGISASTVSHCTVATIGMATAAVSANGIGASLVTDTTVATVAGGTAGSVNGILASEVGRCSVTGVTLAGGSGSCNGVSADVITDSRIANVTSAASGNTVGLSAYRLARACSVFNVSNSGSGLSYAALTSVAGRSEGLALNSTGDFGISITSAHIVTGCNISTAATAIQATGIRNVIDGNNIAGTSTFGIFVVSGLNTAHALIVRNQIRNCTTNIQADTPCQTGPPVSATGPIAAGANPWANFTD